MYPNSSESSVFKLCACDDTLSCLKSADVVSTLPLIPAASCLETDMQVFVCNFHTVDIVDGIHRSLSVCVIDKAHTSASGAILLLKHLHAENGAMGGKSAAHSDIVRGLLFRRCSILDLVDCLDSDGSRDLSMLPSCACIF